MTFAVTCAVAAPATAPGAVATPAWVVGADCACAAKGTAPTSALASAVRIVMPFILSLPYGGKRSAPLRPGKIDRVAVRPPAIQGYSRAAALRYPRMPAFGREQFARARRAPCSRSP